MRLLRLLCIAVADNSGHGLVDFPSVDGPSTSTTTPEVPPPTPYLPFRRISLPSAPNLIQRQSIVSTVSVDSIPEGPKSAPLARGASRGPRHRPSSVEAARRNRRREVKSVVPDEQREAKRRKIVHELCETERSYMDGLELIYSHFLTPIIASLDTPNQLLDRAELTSIFSNFIDIWNLHRSFYSSLSTLLNASTSTISNAELPQVSPILLSHFPYLSLYTPFVSSFADALSSYSALLAKHPNFASFIATQEADPRCGKLKFRDWLLTIVQRCPRYLLLLKDLIHNTSTEDPEYTSLVAAHTLVSKITDSLNASLHTHAQTLSLLAIQRSTSGLPFQLISPGRTFLKRGPLYQIVGSTLKEREFFLFSDCLVWLSNEDRVEDPDRLSKLELLRDFSFRPDSPAGRPQSLVRTRSKSDPDLPRAEALRKRDSGSKLASLLSAGMHRKKRPTSTGEEHWVYKGHIDLVDLEIVLPPSADPSEQLRFELLSPRRSFAVYAFSPEERDEWATAIRNAKASLLVSLNVMHPNSTLTSSTSTNHLRNALQALPYLPDEEDGNPKRGKVEHFVPAIWIPDGKTESCMRCGRTFGWRRRRHHCRLCGRCVCATCSTKTFFIVDPAVPTESKHSHRSARACDACYDTVFPVLDATLRPPEASATVSHLTLSGLRSMPSLMLNDHLYASPSVLMAIDVETPRSPKRPQSAVAVNLPPLPLVTSREPPEGGMPVVRIKAPSRPRSYIQILEDFNDQSAGSSPAGSPATSRFGRAEDGSFVLDDLEEDEEDAGPAEHASDAVDTPQEIVVPPSPRSPRRMSRKEDTVRRRKRFSLPAVALHTTPVTARPNVVGEGKAKRWSLVLGNLKSGAHAGEFAHGAAVGKLNELLGKPGRSAA